MLVPPGAPDAVMLADAGAPAVLASAPAAIMLADAGAPTALALAPEDAVMLADAGAPAPVLAPSALREGCPRTMTGVSQHWFSGHF
jgi:hypothetical protein